MNQSKELILGLIREQILEDGAFAKDVIDQAAFSVKEFANNQADFSSHYATILSLLVGVIAETNPSILDKLNYYNKNQILALVKRANEGTPFWENLSKKLEYKQPDSYGGLLSQVKVK